MRCYEQPAITAITPVMAAPITLTGVKSRLGAAVQGCGVGRRSSGVVQREDSSDLSHDTTSLSPSGHEDVEPPHKGERRPTPHLKALLGRTEART